jgi:hypothetical protein
LREQRLLDVQQAARAAGGRGGDVLQAIERTEQFLGVEFLPRAFRLGRRSLPIRSRRPDSNCCSSAKAACSS